MARRKILYIITKGNWGGAQRYVFDLATALPREEFEPVVACDRSGILVEKLHGAGVRTVLLPSLQRDISLGKELKALHELTQLLKKEQPDIIHLNSSKAAGLGALATIFLKLTTIKTSTLKTIFTVHGWPFKEPRTLLVRIALWLASYVTALLSHHIIVLSQGDLLLGKKMPGIGHRISLVYNGIGKPTALSRVDARKQLSLPESAPVIGSIAELNRNKGIPTLIEALTRLPQETRLCLIGEGEDRKKLEALAVLRGVRERIVFAGGLPDASRYLSAFDVFALASRKEGLPYTILEAGLRTIPVVASDITGIRDIVHNASVGILVPSGDSRALGEALLRLIESPKERKELGLALQYRVEQTFLLERMITQTVYLYES